MRVSMEPQHSYQKHGNIWKHYSNSVFSFGLKTETGSSSGIFSDYLDICVSEIINIETDWTRMNR